MAIKRIVQSSISGGSSADDLFLRTKTIPVTSDTMNLNEMIQDLKDTILAYPFCVGLSAPQIGYSYAISVICTDNERKEFLVLLNPKVVSISGKKDKKRESCMSVWGKAGSVERRDKALIEYQDIDFKPIQKQFTGIISRCIQHEIDHLNGILYIDKLVDEYSLIDAPFFDSFNKV